MTVEGDQDPLGGTMFYKCQACGKPTDPYDTEKVSPCPICHCDTHTIDGYCVKCNWKKCDHDFDSMMAGVKCPHCGFDKQQAYEQAAKLATEEQADVIATFDINGEKKRVGFVASSSTTYTAKCGNCNQSLDTHDTDNCLFHAVIRISQLEDRLKWHTIGLVLVSLNIVIICAWAHL